MSKNSTTDNRTTISADAEVVARLKRISRVTGLRMQYIIDWGLQEWIDRHATDGSIAGQAIVKLNKKQSVRMTTQGQ